MTDFRHRLLEFFGSQCALANRLDIRQQSVAGWFAAGRIPPERCRQIEEITGGEIKREELRPDIFGPVVQVADEAS